MIASRKSRLARIQAERVAAALRKLHPDIAVNHHWVESEGDRRSAGLLAKVGGKGLFTNAVDQAVKDGRADVAVHSLKDLPVSRAEAVPGMQLAAVPKRAVAHDCLISRERYTRLKDLPRGALLGTSSPRRAAQVRRERPDIEVAVLRGNVDTRLNRVTAASAASAGRTFDATILAGAGLHRMGLAEHAERPLSLDVMLPAAGQGALALCCRAVDHVTVQRCLPLNSSRTATAVHAERELVERMGADCYSPIAVLAEQLPPSQTQAVRNADSHWFRLRARVLSADGQTCLQADEKCKTGDLRRVVKAVAQDLLARGGAELLAAAADSPIPDPPAPAAPDGADTPPHAGPSSPRETAPTARPLRG